MIGGGISRTIGRIIRGRDHGQLIMWSTVWLLKLLGGGLLWMMILLEKDSQCQAPVMVQNSDFAETNDK